MPRARLVLFVVPLLLAVACGGDTSAPPADGGTTAPRIPASVSPTEFSSGSETVAIGGDLPDGFPEDFPLPDDAEVLFSGSSGETYAIWFSSDDSYDDLKTFFGDELAANGWSLDSSFDGSTEGTDWTVYAVSGNGYTGGLMLGSGAPGAEGFDEDFAFFVTLSPS